MIARRLRLLTVLIALPFLWSPVATASQATPDEATPVADAGCDVTLPNGEMPPGKEPNDLGWFGSGATDASLWLMMTWENGVQPVQPPATLPNPDEFPLKLTFWRGEGSGEVTVTAQSADGERIPADVFKPFRGTVIPGVHPQGGAVPELGCWTVTATDGNDTITWTLQVGSPDGSCDVTVPNGEVPPNKDPNDLDWFGSGTPDASLWLMMTWDDGTYSSQPSRYQADNGYVTGHALQFAIFRGESSGDITLSAIDAKGQPISDDSRYLYPEYPTPIPGIDVFTVVVFSGGCWALTATDGNDTITWTVLVTTAIDGCDITQPNGEAPTGEMGDRWYGAGNLDASLWVQLPTPPIQWFPDFEPRDNGGHSIKSPFWRGEGSGPITLTGERLDEPSDFEPRIDATWDGYPIPGFIATGIWYPTEGCWELTATDGNDTLTWTVLVQSPYNYCDATSGADDEGGMPHGVTEELSLGDPAAPTTVVHPTPDQFYGENGLYVLLGDPSRTAWQFLVDSEWVADDGAITLPKWFWYREGDATGELTITVQNPAQWFPVEPKVDIPMGYGDTGLQIASITFPGPGCWEVTGTSGDVSITFTVRLEIVPTRE